MTSTAAISINDDFSSGEAAISFWAANNKAAGRVDVVDGVFVYKAFWQDGKYNFFDNLFSQLIVSDRWGVLC